MLDVALWSKFPDGFIESKIEPALEKRGIRVVKKLSERTKQADLSDVVAVLYLHEMAGHSEQDRLSNLASAQGRKIIPLSRKESQWDRNLRNLVPNTLQTGENMAAPRAIADKHVSDLCSAYMELYRKGTPRIEMLNALAKYWSVGKLATIGQLDQQLRSLISTGRAPQAFRTWWEKNRKQTLNQANQTVRKQAAEVAKKRDEKNGFNNKANGHKIIEPVAAPSFPKQEVSKSETIKKSSISPDDAAALDKLLEEEAEKYSKLQKELEKQSAENQAKIAESNRILQELRTENAKLKSLPTSLNDGKMRRIISNLSESVELNIMTPEEAFKKMMTLVKN